MMTRAVGNLGANLNKMRFGRREISGAFGDVGTDLPLIIGMILAAGLDSWWILLVFGLMQAVTAILYGIPIPVQPLKAVAALVIAGQISGPVLRGGALAVALIMALLVLTGALQGLARLIPACVVRGIQIGLGIKLLLLAVVRFIPADGLPGMVLAGACLALLVILLKRPVLPGGAAVLALGIFYALFRGTASAPVGEPALPWFGFPALKDIWTGLLVLALPQIPLSLGNSVLATRQLAADWFPGAKVSVRRIGASYSFFNLVAAFCGGIPVCHGSGGMAGHYALGGRTGGSLVIYGIFFMVLSGFTLAGGVSPVHLFPLPALGVILMVEAAALMGRARQLLDQPFAMTVALIVALTANLAPYGFLTAMVTGSLIHAGNEILRRRTAIARTDAARTDLARTDTARTDTES